MSEYRHLKCRSISFCWHFKNDALVTIQTPYFIHIQSRTHIKILYAILISTNIEKVDVIFGILEIKYMCFL